MREPERAPETPPGGERFRRTLTGACLEPDRVRAPGHGRLTTAPPLFSNARPRADMQKQDAPSRPSLSQAPLESGSATLPPCRRRHPPFRNPAFQTAGAVHACA